MPYEAVHAIWAYYDGKGAAKRTSYKMTEGEARSQLPSGAQPVPGTEETRWLPSNHIEESQLAVPPPHVGVGSEICPAVDLIVCGASSYNNVPRVRAVLDLLNKRRRIRTLVHRQGSPLDFTVAEWAAPFLSIRLIGIPIRTKLDGHNARANQLHSMFSHQLHGVLAFPGDKESTHITEVAMEKGLTVWQPYGP